MSNRERAVQWVVSVVSVVMALCVLPAAGQDQVEVFAPLDNAGRLTHDQTVLRSRAVQVDLDALIAHPEPIGAQLALGLFDDVQVSGVVHSVEERAIDSFTWYGTIHTTHQGKSRPTEGTFILVVEQDAVVVAAWLEDGRTFEVRSDQAGILWVRELEQSRFAPCETTHEHEVHEFGDGEWGAGPLAATVCPDDGSIIDVMIVYTPAARVAAGGTNEIVSIATSSIAAANNAYASSNINTRLRLVYVDEVQYVESGNNSTDLSRLRSTTNGIMDEVHVWRDQYKADIVAMLHDGPGCGIGYLMTNLSTEFQSSAFSITRYTCAVGNLTMAHEIGHNQGCAHDRDNAGNSLFSYSFGHRWFSTNGNQYRSVMAYAPGSRIPRLSNPDVLYIGTPTGIAPSQSNSAANAYSINQAALVISNFRNSGENVGPTITDQPDPLDLLVGQSAVFTVSATGPDPLSYQWRKNGQNLQDDDRITGAQAATLVIDDLNLDDIGNYTVVVTNACAPVESLSAALAVAEPPCPGDIADDFGFTANEGGGPDGVVDFGDFVALLGLIGPCDSGTPGCLGDIADDFGFTADEGGGPDGVVDFGDFVALLGLIGPCQ